MPDEWSSAGWMGGGEESVGSAYAAGLSVAGGAALERPPAAFNADEGADGAACPVMLGGDATGTGSVGSTG
ncbi:MAG: hypothetical protein P4N24_00935 [Acidobacteriota bacterium]|nr:hypothetical protein [Acidobacteriota bacterium]